MPWPAAAARKVGQGPSSSVQAMLNTCCSRNASRQGPSPVSYWDWSILRSGLVGEDRGARLAFDHQRDADERLVVDLTGTTFIDSSGLAVLVRAHHRLGRRPGAVVVHASDPDVRRVFRLSGVDSLITVTSVPP
jgi:ABC-type transporter Mla MlaB component